MKTYFQNTTARPALYAVASITVVLAFLTQGCRTRREIVLEQTDMTNMSFEYARMPEGLRLDEDEDASFVLWNKTAHQSHHVLQLAAEAALKERFHRRHDMTLHGVSGRAIVSVEGTRHILDPGTAVFVPRMHAYTVIPHESPGNLVALMVYSPPFDGRETLVLEK